MDGLAVDKKAEERERATVRCLNLQEGGELRVIYATTSATSGERSDAGAARLIPCNGSYILQGRNFEPFICIIYETVRQGRSRNGR